MAKVEIEMLLRDSVSAKLSGINSKVKSTNKSFDSMGSKTSGLSSQFGKLGTAIKGAFAASTITYFAGEVINLADTYTETRARLGLIADSQKEVVELQNAITDAANRSRSSYFDTANLVGRIGVSASDAFANNDEMVKFAELVNKQFVIAGATTQEQQAATTQLTQAMASGVLRGEELNSIFEQAPTIIQTIADHLDVPIGTIREMAAEGQITSEIVKDAMLSSADKIDAKYKQMPMTFSQLWTVAKNHILTALDSVIQTIGSGAQWIADNWSTISSVILGIATSVGILGAAWLIANSAMIIANAQFILLTAAMRIQTAVQTILNAVMNANPIMLVVTAIAILIGIIVAWINKVGGITKAWEIFKEKVSTIVNAVKNFFTNMVSAISAKLNTMKNFIVNKFNAVVNFIKTLPSKMIQLGKDFLQGFINGIKSKFAALGNVIKGIWDKVKSGLGKLFGFGSPSKEMELRGKWVDQGFANGINRNTKAIVKASKAGLAEPILNTVYTATVGKANVPIKNYASPRTSKNSSGDFSYLRDLAERDAINRFTTAEVKIDMSGMTNSLNNEADLDGLLNKLTEGFSEALLISAEGVHS